MLITKKYNFMSTRAQVRFATREDGVSFSEHPDKIHAQFYVHHDGYPEGLGLDIAESLSSYGKIGGWDIGAGALTANNVVISAVSKSIEITDDNGRVANLKMSGLTATGSIGGGTELIVNSFVPGYCNSAIQFSLGPSIQSFFS